jgi:aminoglycoside phosphotransferase (APT) family kinase protein
MTREMDAQKLVGRINLRHGTRYTLRERYAAGENQGAYALTDEDGATYVLKWNERQPWLERIRLAQRITAHLRTLGVPAPQYVLADTSPDNLTYWIQTALPGAPPQSLLPSHVDRLLELIEIQAGRALSTEINWSDYVRAVVFEGESGWRDSLLHYDADTRIVLARLTQLVADKHTTILRGDDIVHGDLALENVLVVGATVRGIVDWDAAGCGDRCLDLSKLVFYSYADSRLRAPLQAQMLSISGSDAYAIYLAYNILAQLDWSIHHHTAASVVLGVGSAHQILNDLERGG